MLNAISSDSLLRVTHFSDVERKLFVDNEENVGVIAVGRKLRNFAVLVLKMTEWPACRSRVDEKGPRIKGPLPRVLHRFFSFTFLNFF